MYFCFIAVLNFGFALTALPHLIHIWRSLQKTCVASVTLAIKRSSWPRRRFGFGRDDDETKTQRHNTCEHVWRRVKTKTRRRLDDKRWISLRTVACPCRWTVFSNRLLQPTCLIVSFKRLFWPSPLVASFNRDHHSVTPNYRTFINKTECII